MKVRLTESSVRDRVLRVWLRRIPEESGHLHVFLEGRQDSDQPIGTATLYGRGAGSDATERAMLYVRLVSDTHGVRLSAGDLVDLRLETLDGLQDIDFDLLYVE